MSRWTDLNSMLDNACTGCVEEDFVEYDLDMKFGYIYNAGIDDIMYVTETFEVGRDEG